MDKLLTKKEARARLGNIGETTIWRWIQRGLLHPVRVQGSNRVFFKERDIQRLIDASSI